MLKPRREKCFLDSAFDPILGPDTDSFAVLKVAIVMKASKEPHKIARQRQQIASSNGLAHKSGYLGAGGGIELCSRC